MKNKSIKHIFLKSKKIEFQNQKYQKDFGTIDKI